MCAKYLYRGNEDDAIVEELQDRAVEGDTHTVYHARLLAPDEVKQGDRLDRLPWNGLQQTEVGVTGGVSSSLRAAQQFTGNNDYVMVLDAGAADFERVLYEYEWFNEHPGVLDHILTTSSGEVRIENDTRAHYGDLVGAATKKKRMNEPNYTAVRHWSLSGDLPATSARSRFADEAEWVAEAESASLAGLIEGVVSVTRPLNLKTEWSKGRDAIPKDAPPAEEIVHEVYEQYRDVLPEWTTYYLIVAKGRNIFTARDDSIPVDNIKMAYRDDGRIPPESVPDRFRGVG